MIALISPSFSCCSFIFSFLLPSLPPSLPPPLSPPPGAAPKIPQPPNLVDVFVSIGSSVLQSELARLPGRRFSFFQESTRWGGEGAETFLTVLHVSGTVVVRLDLAVATEGLAPRNTRGYEKEMGWFSLRLCWEGGEGSSTDTPLGCVAKGRLQRAPSA